MDWIFLGLFALAADIVVLAARPTVNLRMGVRLAAGAVVGLAVLVFLQVGNNALFDRMFGQ